MGFSGALLSGGERFYGVGQGEFSDNLYSIQLGTTDYPEATLFSRAGEFSTCGVIWTSTLDDKIYSGCGNIFHVSEEPSLDMLYDTSFIGLDHILGAIDRVDEDLVSVLDADFQEDTDLGVTYQMVRHYRRPYLSGAGGSRIPHVYVGSEYYAMDSSQLMMEPTSRHFFLAARPLLPIGLIYDHALIKMTY